jgi:PAS domain S-box-containing protein
MRDYFLNLPIKNKLFLAIFSAALLLSSVGFLAVVYLNTQNVRDEMAQHTRSEVQVLAQDLSKIIVSTDDVLKADVVSKLRYFSSVLNLFLYDDNGELVFQYEKSPSASMLPPAYSVIKKDTEVGFGEQTIRLFLPVEYLGKTFGGVLLRISGNQLGNRLTETYKIIALVISLMLLLSYLLAAWLQRFFSAPINSLAERVRDIADKRNFFEDVTSEDASELGGLYRSIGQLLSAIRDTQQELHQSETRLEAVINIAGSALISIDESHHITLFNRQAEDMFGYAAREVIGRPLSMLLPEKFRAEHHLKIEGFFLQKNSRKRLAAERTDVSGLRKNGEEFPLEASISQVNLGDNKLFTVALTDVTQRRQTERELETYRSHLERVVEGRTRELCEKNSELEAFSYSIAHDLRAPLRSITSFSQILLEDSADKLDQEELDHLRRVVKAGRRMAELIDGILNLARIGRSQMSVVEVDLSILATQAKMRLSYDQPDRNVQWNIQPGLVVQGDSQLLSVAMDNLINNAWKYSSKKASAEISFGTTIERDKQTYFVRDNGAGFDMDHAQALFGVFQRMHKADEFNGTGVGLATVKRIVRRHGGSIWADATVGEGATFYFTLS